MVIGKDFEKILYEEVLTGIAKAVNHLNKDMLVYEDNLYSENMNCYAKIMKETISNYIDGQISAAKLTRDSYEPDQLGSPLKFLTKLQENKSQS